MFEKIVSEIKRKELDEITTKDINEFAFIIYYNDKFLKERKSFMACCCTGTFGRKTVPVIIVDKYFMKLDNISQDIIILHELGHKVDEPQRDYKIRKIEEEIRADNFVKNYYPKHVIKSAMERIFMMHFKIKGFFTEKQKEEINARLYNME